MYQVLTYVQPNGYIILKETNDYEEAKKFFDDIKTEEKLAGEFICHYEIVEVEKYYASIYKSFLSAISKVNGAKRR